MASPAREPEHFNAVCIGETMVSFVATEQPRVYTAIAAGAESNVAIGMARLGCRTRWVSRLGDDPLGRIVEESIEAAGVDVSVVRDPEKPTGVMVKHPAGDRKVSSYHRSESAAWGLGPEDLARVGTARWVHVTGITPALSASARDLVRSVIERRGGGEGRVSFDVNHRPKLWRDSATAADVILPLARGADVVFIGDDEATELYGTRSLRELADLVLRRPDQVLVVKRGADDASAVTHDGVVTVPALPKEVVDVTGAGDAFAAGYLAADCREWPIEARLRLGHVMAGRVIEHIEDTPAALSAEELAGMSPSMLESRWDAARPGGAE